jgi:hypothetical protein
MPPTNLHPKMVEVAKTLRDTIGPHVLDKKYSLNLFLIGARESKGTSQPSMRTRLRKVLEDRQLVQIYYPEDLFGELIFGEQKMDLLKLENLLADSVHAVVICPESPGSFAELGAFANHDRLCKRLIVVGDDQHRKARSFIRLGPLRFLSQHNYGGVFWHNYPSEVGDDLADKVLNCAKEIRRAHPPRVHLGNPVFLERFLLVVISITQPVSSTDLVYIMQKLDASVSRDLIGAALSYLFYKRAIRLESKKYSVKGTGLDRLEQLMSYESWRLVRRTMDQLRIEALNINYRVQHRNKFTFRRQGTKVLESL